MHGEWPPAATLHASGSAWGAIRRGLSANRVACGPKSAIDGCTWRQPYSQKGLDFLSLDRECAWPQDSAIAIDQRQQDYRVATRTAAM